MAPRSFFAIAVSAFALPGWLAAEALEWHTEKDCRWASVAVARAGAAGFSRVASAQSGIDFANRVNEDESLARMLISDGSGVALGDVDGDGLCDLFFACLGEPCRLYRNLGGWKFQDITAAAELKITSEGWYAKGACFADLDGDGHLDLVVTLLGDAKAQTGGMRAFLGNGRAQFREVSAESGLAGNNGSHTVAFADVDGNGTLDLYVANYRNETIRDSNIALTGTRGGQPVLIRETYDHRERLIERLVFPTTFGSATIPPEYRDRFWLDKDNGIHELGLPDQLFLNDGSGKFTAVSWTGGAFRDEDGKPLETPPRDYGLTATFRDFNGDGVPDLYVCNDFDTPDRFWLGDGKGGFQAAPRLAMRNMSTTSMGVDIADINRDGHPDFFVVDMLARTHERRKRQMGTMKPVPLAIGQIENRPEVMRNTLYLNRGDRSWAEIALFAGVAASEWSWQPVFLDIDLDGYEDIFITNGHERDILDADMANQVKQLGVLTARQRREVGRLYERLAPAKVAFRNRGDLTFEEVGKPWGLDTPGIAHGVAEADLDNDGDLDLVVNMFQEPAILYRNNGSAARVAVRLKGRGANWQAIGAKVTLRGGAVPEQSREVFCGGRYLSGGTQQLCFAAGKAAGGMTLEVTWRDGQRSVVEAVKANRIYEIAER